MLFSGEGLKRGSHSSSRSGSRKNRGYSIGLGRSQSGGVSEEAEDALLPNSRLHLIYAGSFNCFYTNIRNTAEKEIRKRDAKKDRRCLLMRVKVYSKNNIILWGECDIIFSRFMFI